MSFLKKILPLIFLYVICIAGCIPQSINPLTAVAKDSTDPALFGTWAWKEKDETTLLSIGNDKQSGQLKAVVINLESDGRMEVSEFSGTIARLDGKGYLSLKNTAPEDEIKDFVIVKYTIAGDQLGLALMENDAMEKAVNEKKIAGTVTKTKWVTNVSITETSEKLSAFVTVNDALLFKEMQYLKKAAF